MVKRLPIIGVMGSHAENWETLSIPLGKYIAQNGYNLVTGAGGGVMATVAQAFASIKDKKGRCIGIYPIENQSELLDKTVFSNEHVDIPIVVPLDKKAQSHAMPYSRNTVNILTSDVVIALPGWHGTKTEVSMALTLDKPLILFGPERSFETFPQDPMRAEDIEEIRVFIDKHTHGL